MVCSTNPERKRSNAERRQLLQSERTLKWSRKKKRRRGEGRGEVEEEIRKYEKGKCAWKTEPGREVKGNKNEI